MAVLRSTAAQVQTVPGQEQGSSRGHRNTFFPMGQGSVTLCETVFLALCYATSTLKGPYESNKAEFGIWLQ